MGTSHFLILLLTTLFCFYENVVSQSTSSQTSCTNGICTTVTCVNGVCSHSASGAQFGSSDFSSNFGDYEGFQSQYGYNSQQQQQQCSNGICTIVICSYGGKCITKRISMGNNYNNNQQQVGANRPMIQQFGSGGMMQGMGSGGMVQRMGNMQQRLGNPQKPYYGSSYSGGFNTYDDYY